MEVTAVASWLNSTFADFDLAIFDFFHRLHDSAAGGFLDVFFNAITTLGHDGIALIIISLVLMLFTKTRQAGSAMLAGIIVGALFTNLTIKPLVSRPRPYTHLDSPVYQWWLNAGAQVESDRSFPSGHTTSAMAMVTGLFCVTNKKVSWVAFLFAVLMGMSRIYLCVHYPTDVIGGLIIGAIGGIIGGLLVNWFYKHDEHKLNKAYINFSFANLSKKKA